METVVNSMEDHNHPVQEPVLETAVHPQNCEATRKLREELKADSKLIDLIAEVYHIKQEIIKWRYIHCSLHFLMFSVLLGTFWYNYSAISEVRQKQESWQGNFAEELQKSEKHLMEYIAL